MRLRFCFIWLQLSQTLIISSLAAGASVKSVGSVASRGGGTGGGYGGDDGGGRRSSSGGQLCSRYCRSGSRDCSGEQRVKEDLMCGYDRTSRPVRNDSDGIRVHIAVALFHILDTDEKHQTFSALMSVRLRWIDQYLTWQPAEYNGTNSLHIPSSAIWTPDVIISNSAEDSSKNLMTTNVILWHNGSVLWMFPALVKVTCTLNVRFFPFDSQSCNVTFISWTYHLFEVDLWHNDSFDNNKNYYTDANQEWNVSRIAYSRTVSFYACCEEPWPDVTITIDMTRRSLFYIFNLIFPCLLMYLASFLGFFLPIESGEKVNLELTILLALVVFLLIVGDTLPPTPDAIPLVGLLFGMTMLMVSMALLMGVIVTNIHIRKFTQASSVPAWLVPVLRRYYCPVCRERRRKLRCPTAAGLGSSSHSNARFIRSVILDHSGRNGSAAAAAAGAGLASTRDGSDSCQLETIGEVELHSCPNRDVQVKQHQHRHHQQNQSQHQSTSSPLTTRRRSVAYVANARRASTITAAPPDISTSAAAPDGVPICLCRSPDGWVALARTVDRLFFWTYLGLTVGVMSYVYSGVPRSGSP